MAGAVHPPSHVFMSETFIFGVLIAILVFTLPVYLSGSWDMGLRNGTISNQDFVSQVTDTVISTTDQVVKSAANTDTLQAVVTKPVPYLRQLPSVVPHLQYGLWFTFLHVPYLVLEYFLFLLSLFWALLARILRPAIILSQVTFEIFIETPLRGIASLGRWLYPIYVFLGVALLVGGVMAGIAIGVGKLGLYLAKEEPGNERALGKQVERYQEEKAWRATRRDETLGRRVKKVEFAT